MSASELRKREVVDSFTAERLGFVSDLDIDYETGLIKSIIVPRKRSIFNLFTKNYEYVIPWENIEAMGSDIILVRLPPPSLSEK